MILQWLESSVLGHLMRDTGPWTYAIVNLAHLLGIAALFGTVLLLDLRMLGLWRRLPLVTLTTIGAPLAGAGFMLAVTSGLGLLSANASDYVGNPFMLIKFPAIALGAANAVIMQRTAAWRALPHRQTTRAEDRTLAVLAAISLASWLTAVTAGRMVGYW